MIYDPEHQNWGDDQGHFQALKKVDGRLLLANSHRTNSFKPLTEDEEIAKKRWTIYKIADVEAEESDKASEPITAAPPLSAGAQSEATASPPAYQVPSQPPVVHVHNFGDIPDSPYNRKAHNFHLWLAQKQGDPMTSSGGAASSGDCLGGSANDADYRIRVLDRWEPESREQRPGSSLDDEKDAWKKLSTRRTHRMPAFV